MIGKSKAIELMTTGKLLEFEEAKELGIVNHIFELEGFFNKVLDYARRFTPPAKASKAVGLIRRSVQSGVEVAFLEGLSIGRELQQQLFTSTDAKEGLAAYV